MSRLRIHQTRSVKFKNGGTITVTLSRVNLAVLTQDERKFVFGLVDSLETQSRALREGFGLVDSLETQSRASVKAAIL